MTPRALALAALLATACGSSGPPAPPVRPGEERDPFTDYTVPGLTLWRVHGSVPDHEWSSVVGVDASGHVVPSRDVFLRAVTPGLPPETVATRSIEILGLGGGLLHTPADASNWGTPEQRAQIVPPVVTDGTLVMWMLVGEMAPHITRVQVVLATGVSSHTAVEEVMPPAPAPPPPAPPS